MVFQSVGSFPVFHVMLIMFDSTVDHALAPKIYGHCFNDDLITNRVICVVWGFSVVPLVQFWSVPV